MMHGNGTRWANGHGRGLGACAGNIDRQSGTPPIQTGPQLCEGWGTRHGLAPRHHETRGHGDGRKLGAGIQTTTNGNG